MRARNGDYEIEYETFGDPTQPTVLFVNGLGSQLIAYRDDWCQLVADAGFHVVRYDNRDVGLSTKTPGNPPALADTVAALSAGLASPAAYSVSDMAADGMAVLDDLGVVSAHIWGMSMGGMIVQTMAIEHPERVRSMTSVMSTTGARSVGQSTPEASAALMSTPPSDRAGFIDADIAARHVYASHDVDWDEVRSYVGAQYDRCYHPIGVGHQMAAVISDGDRTERLAALSVPTTVIHGAIDTLITVSGGEATAAAIEGAKLVVYPTMGHDLPRRLWPALVDELVELAHRAA